MKNWLCCFVLLSSFAQADEVIIFEEPPTANEILESFGEPVVRTRGIKKSRKVVFNNQVDMSTQPTQAASVPVAIASEPQPSKSSSAPKSKKYHKKPVAFPLTFSTGSDVLSKEAQKYIDSMVQALKQKPDLMLHISGHTDIAGGDDVNKPLSLSRAEAVKDYLKEHGISESRLETSGEGSLFLLDIKDPYAEVNRRVQFDKIDKGN